VSAERNFPALLEEFAAAGVANDGAQFAALFTEDATYDDNFFGLHRGRGEIAAMPQRFHDTGENYRWEFDEPVFDGTLGYASFRFSFSSKMPGYEGRPVLIQGISCFRLRTA
jgi:SnoaL-like protein